MNYHDFIKAKEIVSVGSGFHVDRATLNPNLFEWQKDVVVWALGKGRAALFEGCGLGKTLQQLEWANHVYRHTDGNVLILAPLAVADQTVREGSKFGIDVTLCRKQSDVKPGINITNYEMLPHFDTPSFAGVVLDESGIIKAHDGKTRQFITDSFSNTPYRLACTATPSPNDHIELGTHAEFLGVMKRSEMLSMFFTHNSGDTSKWDLKGHAGDRFWKWVCSWAVMIQHPSDIGYSDDGYVLPPMIRHQHVVELPPEAYGFLVMPQTMTLQERRAVRRASLEDRVAKCAEIVNASADQFVVWCDLCAESDALAKAIPDAVEVTGSDSREFKTAAAMNFVCGRTRVLISKASIFGFGLNLQGCHNVVFVGLSDSFEAIYQAERRCWRFGQQSTVNVHIITSDGDGPVVRNIERKERAYAQMVEGMLNHMRVEMQKEIRSTNRNIADEQRACVKKGIWELRLGDCVEETASLPDDSIDLTLFSPPFAALYTYSNSYHDMGNSRSSDEFKDHFAFLSEQLFRVTRPGRIVAFHCMNIPAMKERDGYIGIKDFRGDLIRIFQAAGFIYHSEHVIWKDPLTEAVRTKAIGLMHKQLCKDSSMSRSGLPDYIVAMRKPGTNGNPIRHIDGLTSFAGENEPTEGTLSHERWRRYASPVWMDIRQSNTLNGRIARHEDDTKHICIARGSLVLTRDGYIPIETVRPGDKVLTHKGRWRDVLATRCNGIKPVISTCAQGVASLTTTPDHQIWCRHHGGAARPKEKAMSTCPQWISAQSTLGSYVNLKLPPTEDSQLTNDEWWLVGRWLGDGHVGVQRGNGHPPYVLSCSHQEAPELMERLTANVGSVVTLTATQFVLKKLRPAVISILAKCGHGASRKRLPCEAICLSQDKAESLLSGYLSADGHYVPEYDRWTASSVSRSLLLGMAMVAQRARGVVASVYAGRGERTCTIEGRTVNCRQEWIFGFRDSDGYKKSGWIQDDGAWKKVRRLESHEPAEVWDIQVEEDESFTAEGCIVHNCPLQLDVIERVVDLWSAEGDSVLDPFAGIGSTGYQALKMGRRFIGFELKKSYWDQALSNMELAMDDARAENGLLFTEDVAV